MNRQFYRSSVGGLDEVAEIKGHRRTFVASFPGRIVQALKVAGTSNPLILIDEIDKLSHFPGGPGAALLEVLDPQQNHSFNDHYLNVPCDLSRVLFVCTANDMSPIPRPLKDRMQIIPLSGYVLDEKVTIARRYLLPQLCKSMGIQRRLVNFKESALKGIAQHYSRESGVRSMKRNVETIIARQLSETDGEKEKTVVTADTLPHYLGHPRFYNERMYKKTPPEAVLLSDEEGPGRSIQITGSVQSVMEESVSIALSLATSFLSKKGDPASSTLRKGSIHIHFPAGATPKDGPSAGAAITTAFISLALRQSIVKDLAMTGEVSLTGKVLRVGGMKEKLLAAKREGVKTIIVPIGNKGDVEKIKENL
eukprot:CAMPEP_0175920528 /NCGR_PEP_ID=MMETSP0108-20121206/12973_1 /TAXON_ID=195067 ORGANISM="Goniomonas pacifica, Strain CCMP1869" /NCGR_SAMPLE_ID=MMETSP0108 /ASSEMBLY_ACC=CAM_ASM_000204 /LENGTH=364 /DNA_ID=CAMNT_0017243243 /DNA_START=271 /DNA_END=1362 /DNA_ORIENTATION=-